MLKSVTKELLVPKTSIKQQVYWVKRLTEKKRASLRNDCIKGKIESYEIWENNRCAVCTNCPGFRETRTIGAYTHVNGDKEELLNEQTEHCSKYGHEKRYDWNTWERAREEERLGSEGIWRRI